MNFYNLDHTIYLNSSIRIFNKLIDQLDSVFLDYFYISTLPSSLDNEVIYALKQSTELTLYFQSDNEIAVNSFLIKELNRYAEVLAKECQLCLVEGYDVNNNLSGYFTIDNQTYKLFSSNKQKDNNLFKVKIVISINVIDALEATYQKYRYLSDNISLNSLGVIILDEAKISFKETEERIVKEIAYSKLVAPLSLSLKEKYEYLESRYVNYLLIINASLLKKDEVKIKDELNEETIIVPFNKANETLNNLSLHHQQTLSKSLLEANYLLLKGEKAKYYCKNCLKNVTESFYLPLTKHLHNKKCILCNQDAEELIVQIK